MFFRFFRPPKVKDSRGLMPTKSPDWRIRKIQVILHTDHCQKSWLPWFDGLIAASEEYLGENKWDLLKQKIILGSSCRPFLGRYDNCCPQVVCVFVVFPLNKLRILFWNRSLLKESHLPSLFVKVLVVSFMLMAWWQVNDWVISIHIPWHSVMLTSKSAFTRKPPMNLITNESLDE